MSSSVIPAEKAKEITGRFQDTLDAEILSQINTKIEIEANRGNWAISFGDCITSISHSAKAYLESRGYKVKYISSSDPREDYSYYVISWGEQA
jgi:hypothetical protein